VKAANEAAQGNASEEALIVAAQAVSASTTQLVTASTVKADPNSESQRKLRDASSRVTQATGQLVNAAKAAAQWEQEQSAVEQDEKYNLAENKIKEMEKQMEILRLEKALEAARSNLGKMRKDEYTGSGVAPVQQKQTQAPVGRGRGRGVNWNTNPNTKPQPQKSQPQQ